MKNLVAIVGPTAVGKTELSLRLAERLSGEIISLDSMQIYRFMDIGTAKIMPEEMRGIPHHLIDIVDPNENFSVADYQRLARAEIDAIHNRGKIPILVGGTGLYFRAVVDPLDFSGAGENAELREELRRFVEREGALELHNRLKQVDPQSARRLHPNDVKRVIRALEVYLTTGHPMHQPLQKLKTGSMYRLAAIGLTMERELLYRRINDRVDQMIEAGLVDEVKWLLEQGYGHELNSMQAIGYKEIAAFIRGECTLEEAIELIKRGSRRYAKRQLSWFRRDNRIQWFDVTGKTLEEVFSEIVLYVEGILYSNEEYNLKKNREG